MRSRLVMAAVAGWICLGSACGSESDPPDTSETKDTLDIALPEFVVPVGESFKCFYSDVITDRELSVVAAVGAQEKGGHHLSLYYVDIQRPVGIEDCSGTTEMADWHFVVGAGGEGNANEYIRLEEGLAFKIPPGKQLMVQAHYINVTGAEMPSADAISVELIDPAKVEAYAADFVVDDDQWVLEANAELTTRMTCEVPVDVQLTMLLGHMHEQGTHFKLEEVDHEGRSLRVLYEEDWAPSFASHPPLLFFSKDEPLLFPRGTRLRQSCTWKNTTDKALTFPTEMCIGFGYYFPGTERVMCERIEETQ